MDCISGALIMYKLIKSPFTNEVASVIRTLDNAFIPFDPANTCYQQYLKWLSEGNQPLPPDEPLPADE
jgi:hypothetical protein